MTEEQIPHNWRWQRNCYFCVKNLVFSLEHMLFLPDEQSWVTTESINFRHRDWINRWKDLKSFAIFYQIPVEYETVSYPCVYFAGSASCGLNVHNIRHLVECVENWGPLWAWSCFGFEGMNGEMMKFVHGTKNICLQVAAYLPFHI